MATEIIKGYKVEYDIDPEKARKAVEFFLDFGMMCTDKKNAVISKLKTFYDKFADISHGMFFFFFEKEQQ